MMSAEIIESAIQMAASKLDWISWIIASKQESARSTLEFLKSCFANIPEQKRPGIFKKFSGDKNQVEATVYELVAHELLRRLDLSPVFEPSHVGLTPDLGFVVEGKYFIGDVYLTHSPTKTLIDKPNGTGEAWDNSQPGESRAKKIADVLANKARKYASLDMPLVVFVFLGDHRILSANDVEKALFGMTINEILLEERFPEGVPHYRTPIGGLLLPDDCGGYNHRNLSAVISCDWFDTLNTHERGKRLHCLVLHNWKGLTPLPVKAFRDFPQVYWDHNEEGAWVPKLTLNTNIVAQFACDSKLEFGQYTACAPW